MTIWTPRPDQRAVLDAWGDRWRGALWLPTGAGKTAIASTLLERWLFDECSVSMALIVAPKLVARDGWTTEWQRWEQFYPLAAEARVITFDMLGMKRGAAGEGLVFTDKRATKARLRALGGRIHICSWGAFPFVAQAWGKNWPYEAFVPDESSFLRDGRSERGRAARHAVHRTGRVTRLVELTATPNANDAEAVVPQLDLIERGALGSSLIDFREAYCQPKTKNWQTGVVYSWELRPDKRANYDAVCSRLAISAPSALRVPLLQVEQRIPWASRSELTREAYAAMRKNAVWRGIVAGSEAVVQGKLRQMANGFVYRNDDAEDALVNLDDEKTDRLAELVEAVDGPVLVGYHFKQELWRLRERFKGAVMDIREPTALATFKAGGLKLLAAHPASAAHGIDGLQRVCSTGVWMSVPQDQELRQQLEGRIARHGTEAESVTWHYLIAEGTVERDIYDEVLPGKASMLDLTLRAARMKFDDSSAVAMIGADHG